MIARLNVGGPTQHVVLLTAALSDRYPTLLLAGDVEPHEADMTAFAAARGVAVERVPGLGRSIRPLDDLRALWRLYRLCRRHRPRIVHTHTAKAGTLGRVAALLAGVPVRVHTYHGHVFHGYFGRAKTALFLAIERALARVTTRIVAISPSQAAELSRLLRVDAARIVTIPLGLDLARFAQAGPEAGTGFRSAIGAGPDDVVVAIVGRLAPIKNHALAFRALARVRATHPQLLLAVVGGGEAEVDLRRQAQDLGVAERVRFAGWRDDLEAVYQGSDIVALTSDNEGTPVAVIEALASGRPVVATDVGGVRDVLEDGRLGTLVPPGDVDALAGALARLADPAQRRPEPGERERTVTRFGVARLAADVAALYGAVSARADAL